MRCGKPRVFCFVWSSPPLFGFLTFLQLESPHLVTKLPEFSIGRDFRALNGLTHFFFCFRRNGETQARPQAHFSFSNSPTCFSHFLMMFWFLFFVFFALSHACSCFVSFVLFVGLPCFVRLCLFGFWFLRFPSRLGVREAYVRAL